MARFPGDFLQKVRDNTNILDVVGSYVSLKKKGKRYWACCPFHQEKTPSFSISPEDGLYYCFGCHAGGDVFSFVEKMENLSFMEAVERLAEAAHLELPQAEVSPEEKRRKQFNDELYHAMELAVVYFHNCLRRTNMGKPGLAYFKRRHLTDETIDRFKLGFAPDSWHKLYGDFRTIKHISDTVLVTSGLVGHKNGRYYDTFRNRCMFPILNLKGKPVAFGGRVMDDSKPKYLNSPETPIFNKRQLLFALYQALPEIRRTRQVIMVEGYMDAISLHAHGVTNAVASLGTAFTIEQARLLKRYADEVVFSYDMDAAGQNATRRALEIAGTTGLKMRVLHLSEGKDPDEFVNKYGGEAYKEAVAQAIPALDYLFNLLLETHDRTSLEGQHLILNDMFTVLSARGDSFEFNTYIQKMARVLKVDEGLVRNEARLFARKNNPRVYISQRVQNMTESVEEDKEKEKIEALEKAIIRYCFITGRRPDGWEYLSTHTFSNAFCGRMYGILATLYAAGQPWTKENAQGLMEHEDMEYLAPLLVKEGRIAISPWEEYVRPLVILTLQKEYRVHTEKAAEMLRQGKKQEAAEEQLLCLKINRQIRNLRKG
ncbi:DNA primase [Allisonella histaminiformans]|uniref:DNA primase n=1 Tax=Allisonella histaminiformans TaxID=209880 RepID=UPI002943F7B7|nr:DNA primase [Allisonella histaminiformans]